MTDPQKKTGAECLVETLVNANVDVCFSNPGTSEMHMVAAIDKVDGMRPVLCLFEGVASGASDGYARMTGRPACTLLHLGPGMGNAIANLHNAQRARSPIINIVGDHATYHQHNDAPLASDIASYARPFSGWYHEARDADTMPELGARAVAASLEPPGQIATLVVPADCAWNESKGPADPYPLPERANVPDVTISKVAEALRGAKKPVLLTTGQAITEKGLGVASRIAKATGAELYCDTFNQRLARGAGRAIARPLPYFAEMALEALEGTDLIVLIGTKAPVAFFAYPGKACSLVPDGCQTITLARPSEDMIGAMEALADLVGASDPAELAGHEPAELQTGDLTPESIGRAVGHFMPENAIVSDEMATSGLGSTIFSLNAQPHDWLQLTGGAIGQGLPVATGAAVACPDRKVLALQADGSGMYTLQSLWTMAREQLNVLVVIFNNRSYNILKIELARVEAQNPGPKAFSMLDLGKPDMSWAHLAQGMGVEAAKARTADEFNDLFSSAVKRKGPFLIDAMV